MLGYLLSVSIGQCDQTLISQITIGTSSLFTDELGYKFLNAWYDTYMSLLDIDVEYP